MQVGDPDQLLEANPLDGLDVVAALALRGDGAGELGGDLPLDGAVRLHHLQQIGEHAAEEVPTAGGEIAHKAIVGLIGRPAC